VRAITCEGEFPSEELQS